MLQFPCKVWKGNDAENSHAFSNALSLIVNAFGVVMGASE
jgi:hypothetical protein